jgi:hypothetical protein
MNRRITLMLTGLMFLGLATAASSNLGFAQTSQLMGSWKLDLTKSKYTPGVAPRSQTNTYEQDGQNIKATTRSIDAQGNPTTTVFMHIYDGQPHPTTGSPVFDASTYLRLNGNTIIFSRSKAGKLVSTGTNVVSPEGKTLTVTTTGILDANGVSGTNIAVYDKQ